MAASSDLSHFLRLVAQLAALLSREDAEGEEDDEELIERDGKPERMAPWMTRAERAKARRTLLGEYGQGQMRVLPEHLPMGPAPQVSLLGPRRMPAR